ncbi:hypothetical protein M885DRAFT_617580, partial [Pelagophyceae sp. CCMP2097]
MPLPYRRREWSSSGKKRRTASADETGSAPSRSTRAGAPSGAKASAPSGATRATPQPRPAARRTPSPPPRRAPRGGRAPPAPLRSGGRGRATRRSRCATGRTWTARTSPQSSQPRTLLKSSSTTPPSSDAVGAAKSGARRTTASRTRCHIVSPAAPRARNCVHNAFSPRPRTHCKKRAPHYNAPVCFIFITHFFSP